MKVSIVCAHCDQTAFKEAGAVNRSRRDGLEIYCGRSCSGLARRTHKSAQEKIAEKALYDAAYRKRNAAMLRDKKAAYYAVNFDREKERRIRQARMPQHIEYCRRPEYRQWKAEYDKKYNARKGFGDFGEAAIILYELCAEISSRISRIDIYAANGTLNKWLQRRREYDRQTVGS